MFRFRQQAFKIVPKFPSQLIYRMRLPYIHPPHVGPAYMCTPRRSTIVRQFSSVIDSPSNPGESIAQGVKNSGKLTEIPRIPRDSEGFHAFYTDLNHETLRTMIANTFGIPYLSPATEDEVKRVVSKAHGCVYGMNYRAIVPFAVSHNGNSCWVFFIVDGASTHTYFSAQASKALGIAPDSPKVMVTIGGHVCPAYMASVDSPVPDINFLGRDFMALCGVYKLVDYGKRQVTLDFSGKCKLVEPSEA